MLPEVESLLIVQDRDQKIQALQQELAKIPRDKARAEEKLSSDTLGLANAKSAVQQNEVAIKKLELDIGTRRTTIDRLKVQQFETKKNDEYNTLGDEIVRYTELVDDLETQELELMEKADELRAAQATAAEALAATQKLVDIDLADLDRKATQAQSRLQEGLEERASLVQKVDDSLLALYQRLLKSKGSDPVAPTKGSQCGGCHMKITATTVVKVQTEKEITQCENCGRILYQP